MKCSASEAIIKCVLLKEKEKMIYTSEVNADFW